MSNTEIYYSATGADVVVTRYVGPDLHGDIPRKRLAFHPVSPFGSSIELTVEEFDDFVEFVKRVASEG